MGGVYNNDCRLLNDELVTVNNRKNLEGECEKEV